MLNFVIFVMTSGAKDAVFLLNAPKRALETFTAEVGESVTSQKDSF